MNVQRNFLFLFQLIQVLTVDQRASTASLFLPAFRQTPHVCKCMIISQTHRIPKDPLWCHLNSIKHVVCLQLLSPSSPSLSIVHSFRKNRERRPSTCTGCLMMEVRVHLHQLPALCLNSRMSTDIYSSCVCVCIPGLTLLLPYLLTRRKRWAKCKVRVFVGGDAEKKDEQKQE